MRRLKFGLDPLISKKRDHRTIQVESSGMLTGSFAEVFSRVLFRSWVERSLMTYSGRTMAWPKRNAPWENSSGICQPSRSPYAEHGPIDEVRDRAGIGRVDRRMHHPPHQVLADDVVIDHRQGVARAQEPLVGGAKVGVGPGGGLAAANHIDQAVVQQREQRRQLRHDGMIVVARIGNQRFGQRNAMSRNAAIDPGDILGRGPRDVAERAAGLDAPSLSSACGRAAAWCAVRRSAHPAHRQRASRPGRFRTGFRA